MRVCAEASTKVEKRQRMFSKSNGGEVQILSSGLSPVCSLGEERKGRRDVAKMSACHGGGGASQRGRGRTEEAREREGGVV